MANEDPQERLQNFIADTLKEDDESGGPKPFHDIADDPQERLKQTVEFWEKGDMDYPVELNPTFEKEFKRLTEDKKNLKVLIPLCGKAVELKWLSEKGHDVVGVDIAEKAAKDFFSDNKLEYSVEPVPSIDGKVFTCKTMKLKYYCGNFFKFSPELEGRFDVVFDAAGFVSLDKRDWDQYLEVFKKIISPSCVFLFEVMMYNTKKFKGPPYAMESDEIKQVFGKEFPNIQLIEIREDKETPGFPFHFYCLKRM